MIGFGGLVILGGFAHWYRWIEPHAPIEPHSSAGRLYLGWLGGLAFCAVGLIVVVDALGGPEVLGGLLLAVCLLGIAANMPILIFQPEWFRPAWQKRHVRLFRARQALIERAGELGHDLIVVLTVADDEEPVTSAVDVRSAVDAATAALASRPDAEVAAVLDLRDERIVETIARSTS
jgi:hypothetical protein